MNTEVTESGATAGWSYEFRAIAILSIAVGIMSFEQTGISYLIPFIQPDFHLSNVQAALLISVYWLAFGLSSMLTGRMVDSLGRRKRFLVCILLLISAGACVSAAARSFAMLLAARALMGVVEGPIVQVAQSIAALESSPLRRGTNMGIVGNLGGAILGMFVAPMVLVRVAERFGWHCGFLFVVLPALVWGLVTARWLREPTIEESSKAVTSATVGSQNAGRLAEALTFRNVYLCALLCCLFVAYLSLGFTFFPLFFLKVRNFSSEQMSLLMGMLGISAVLYAVLVPFLSDRIGRKPVMILATALSLLCPLSVLLCSGPLWILAILLVLTWAMPSTGGLIMGAIPSETVPPRAISTALGLIVAAGVVVGGLAGPTTGGWFADHWGLRAALLLHVGCAASAILISMALEETAPRRRHVEKP